MAQNFLACDRDQELLLPPSLREWLPEGHLAWFVIDAVAALAEETATQLRLAWEGAAPCAAVDAGTRRRMGRRRPLRHRGLKAERVERIAPAAERFWRFVGRAIKATLRRESHDYTP